MGSETLEMVISRFEIYWVRLDPTEGSEIRKTRPCLVLSPDVMNHRIKTVIVAPLTSGEQNYPTRVSVHFDKKQGQVALDQIRTVDKKRLGRLAGKIDAGTAEKVIKVLSEMFAP